MTDSLNDSVSKDRLITDINEKTTQSEPLLESMYENKVPGDEGIIVEKELHVGTPGAGMESAFGEGDSHVEGMVALTTQDDITFIDNTVAAKSASGSPWNAFGGVGVGATFYLGSDLILCGMKVKVATLVDPGTGAVIREFWNGSSWVEFRAMATDADPPYTQRADNIGTTIGDEQVRFGECDGQVKLDIDGNLKFWVRFRVTSALTSDGTNEQIKLHTNRFEIGEDGFTDHYGESIYKKDLVMHWALTEELSGFSPQNETINFASGISLVYKTNQLNNAQTSGRGGFIEIPEGVDTSKNIDLEILFLPLDGTAGDVLFELDTYQTNVGDLLTVANAPETQQTVHTIPISSLSVLQKEVIGVDVQNLVPGEILAFGLKRIGGDVLDTYSSNIAIVNIRATGSFWKP